MHVASLGVLLILLLLAACNTGNNSSDALLTLVHERDSLMAESSLQRERLDKINSMVSTINSVLDSIAIQENMLFIDPGIGDSGYRVMTR